MTKNFDTAHLRARLSVVALVTALLTGCSGGSGGNSGASDTDAWIACKDAVKARLKNPATADFALLKTTIKPKFIDGVLTAENNYGVEQELQFHCKRRGSRIMSTEVLPTH